MTYNIFLVKNRRDSIKEICSNGSADVLTSKHYIRKEATFDIYILHYFNARRLKQLSQVIGWARGYHFRNTFPGEWKYQTRFTIFNDMDFNEASDESVISSSGERSRYKYQLEPNASWWMSIDFIATLYNSTLDESSKENWKFDLSFVGNKYIKY